MRRNSAPPQYPIYADVRPWSEIPADVRDKVFRARPYSPLLTQTLASGNLSTPPNFHPSMLDRLTFTLNSLWKRWSAGLPPGWTIGPGRVVAGHFRSGAPDIRSVPLMHHATGTYHVDLGV